MNWYDEITYQNAEKWAVGATDQELIDYDEQMIAADGAAIEMGGRGLIDEPYWNECKRELCRRNLARRPVFNGYSEFRVEST